MKLPPQKTFTTVSLAVVLAFVLPCTSMAQFALWINPGSTNDYSDSSLWIWPDGGSGVPGPANDAYIFDGTLQVANGGDFNPLQLIMGWESFHVGEFLQTGGSTRTESWTKVGLAGNQVFNMSGGDFSAADLAVGWINPATSAVGTGVMNLSGGTFESRAATFIGLEGATGTLNISGGTFNAAGNDWGSFRIADYGTGTGTLNLSGTGVVNASRYTAVGGWGNGTLNISGGTWNQAAGGIVVGDAADLLWTGSGVVNQSGGTVNADYVLLQKGTYNLDGGFLSTAGVADTKAETPGVLNLNGGWLLATGPNPDFITADAVEIKTGGAVINTREHDITIAMAMMGTGGLNKGGSGILRLAGTNSYAGFTTVVEGKLVVSGAIVSTNSGAYVIVESVNPANPEPPEIEVVDGATLSFAGPFGLGWQLDSSGKFTQSGGAVSVTNGFMILADSANSVGTADISGGTLNVAKTTLVGRLGSGTLNISGGTFNAGTDELGSFRIGDFLGGPGAVTLSGSGVVNAPSYTAVGGWGNGTLTIDGGTWNQAAGGIVVGDHADPAWTGRGDVNQNSGTVNADYVYLQQGTYELNGGTLAVNGIADTATNATGVFNFNGGTLLALESNADFLQADAAEIKSGGAILDTGTNSIAILQGLTGSGGLTKKGAGILALAGANSYSGSTTVENGTLAVSNAVLTAAVQPGSTTVNFSTPPGVGAYGVLPGPLDTASLAATQVDGLGAGLTGTLTNNPNLQVVVTAQSGYAGWSEGAPLNSTNLLLYAIGGASSPTATDGVASVTTVNSNTLSITAVVRTNDPTLAVFGQSILNLATGTWITNDVSMSVSTNQAGVPANTQRQIFSTPRSTNDVKKFLRLQSILSGQ